MKNAKGFIAVQLPPFAKGDRGGFGAKFRDAENSQISPIPSLQKRGTERLQGFTLIELVMIILITGILAMSGYHLMQFVVKNSFYLPNQVQADLVAAEALEIIVEGDSQAKGLRFCKAVTTAAANTVVITNQDNTTITYSSSGGSLFRTIAPGAAAMIPYFKAADMTLAGVGGTLFTYYDSADAVTATPANVRRISINLIAQNGTGSSDKYEGTSQQSSSVKVCQL